MRRVRLIFPIRQMSKTKKGETKPVETKAIGPILADKNGNVTIQILAKPGAKSNNITNINEDGVGVQIAAKAVDGEANAKLLEYMSEVLNLKKNEISLEKGSKSRQKTLLICKKEYSVEQIYSKLKEEME